MFKLPLFSVITLVTILSLILAVAIFIIATRRSIYYQICQDYSCYFTRHYTTLTDSCVQFIESETDGRYQLCGNFIITEIK